MGTMARPDWNGWMKSPRNRGVWLGGLLVVVFLPTIFYVFAGARQQTSIVDHLVTVTGVQSAGLLVYTAVIGTRFKSRVAEFGVPFHRWIATSCFGLVLVHILLVLVADPNNVVIFTVLGAPARGAAAVGALIYLGIAIALGIWRRQSRLNAVHWRIAHVSAAWASGIFALAHILWIDQLVNDTLWLIVFMCILLTAVTMWLTKPKGVSNTVTGPLPKFAKWVVIIGVIVGMFGVFALWNNPSAASIGYTQHGLGPVGPPDRDMLFKVKQAGLWEMPVGQEASERATTQELRDVAQRIAVEHHELDVSVSRVAEQLAVQLPIEPSPDQKRWMREITESSGITYDRNAVFLMRQAHGRVLPLLASVRAGTRNELIRQFADEAIEYVNRHMNYLESTGLVDFSQLPEAPPPSPYQQPEEASFFDSYDTRTLIVAALIVAIVAVMIAMLISNLWKDNGKPTRPTATVNTTAVIPVGPRHRVK